MPPRYCLSRFVNRPMAPHLNDVSLWIIRDGRAGNGQTRKNGSIEPLPVACGAVAGGAVAGGAVAGGAVAGGGSAGRRAARSGGPAAHDPVRRDVTPQVRLDVRDPPR